MMDARHEQVDCLLRTLSHGGLSDQQRERIERELAEIRQSMQREQEWRRLTQARHQPQFKLTDPYQ